MDLGVRAICNRKLRLSTETRSYWLANRDNPWRISARLQTAGLECHFPPGRPRTSHEPKSSPWPRLLRPIAPIAAAGNTRGRKVDSDGSSRSSQIFAPRMNVRLWRRWIIGCNVTVVATRLTDACDAKRANGEWRAHGDLSGLQPRRSMVATFKPQGPQTRHILLETMIGRFTYHR